MAYNLKYQITAATKNNEVAVVEMYIDEVVAAVIEYPATAIQLQYIPRSDDIFEPIYRSGGPALRRSGGPAALQPVHCSIRR